MQSPLLNNESKLSSDSTGVRIAPTARKHDANGKPVVSSKLKLCTGVALIHENMITRLGIQHAWSTSEHLYLRGVAGEMSELHDVLSSNLVEVAVLGVVPDVDDHHEAAAQVIRRAVAEYSHIKWIVMSTSVSQALRETAEAWGAMAFIEEPIDLSRLDSIIMWVVVGRKVFDTSSRPSALQATAIMGREPRPPRPHVKPNTLVVDSVDTPSVSRIQKGDAGESKLFLDTPISKLSERETEVLRNLAAGMTNQQIADQLFLSVKTIETYRSRLKKKLGIKDRAEIVAVWQAHQSQESSI